MKAYLVPLRFAQANEREVQEFAQQMEILQELYGDVAEFLPPVTVGEALPSQADAIVFPQMIFAAYREDAALRAYSLPMIVITSRYGTVEMWDWEIITYLRGLNCRVFAPYQVDMAKTLLRAFGAKKELAKGATFLMFQDTPGEGMQANIFKKFYWWEEQSTRTMEDVFGCRIVYKSWKDVNEAARRIAQEDAERTYRTWNLPQEEVGETQLCEAARLYLAIKETIRELGGVAGVGANCLNESFHSKTTPCLAWNMLFEQDGIIWACEGDTLTMLSTYILYKSAQRPIMMTNLYPFLSGMAALAHEKIKTFPEIDDPDNHALGVHCGYFGFVPRCFCTQWTVRPKVLEIVSETACMIDCRMPKGPVTLAKIYPGFQKLGLIEAWLEDYVQYPGSDCRNGALIRYRDGHRVMETLCSHHMLILTGDVRPQLRLVAAVFSWEVVEL